MDINEINEIKKLIKDELIKNDKLIGGRVREDWMTTYHYNLYNFLISKTNFLPDDSKLRERIYCFFK